MLQRIQTVYLLIIVVLTTATLFLSLATIQSGDALFSFDASGITSMTTIPQELVYPTWGLFALTVVIALTALVTIFLFRKRILQMRICVFNALLMLGFYGLFAFFVWTLKGQLGEAHVSVKIALSFPLINLILDYLAIRSIGADEALVRSLERLR
ncbi:MAG: DUF4293 domain-containing protein [Tannerellaceae bacterium]